MLNLQLNTPTLLAASKERPNRDEAMGSFRGGSRIFFRRGCTRLLLYFNTNKPHSIFFGRIPVVLENRRSAQEGGGAHPLHPPPRCAPVFRQQIKSFQPCQLKKDYNALQCLDSLQSRLSQVTTAISDLHDHALYGPLKL